MSTDNASADDLPLTPVKLPDGLTINLALYPTGDRWLSDVLRRGEQFDPHVAAVCRALLRDGDQFVDVGAHIGHFTLIGAALVGPTGRVVAIEPAPGNVRALRRAVAAADTRQVAIHSTAVGADAGEARLSLSEENQGDHRLELDAGNRQTIVVPVRRLDTLVEGRVDLVKMDTQGSETAVLAGMAGLFPNSPRLRLVTELWPYALERCGTSAEALISSLLPHFDRFWYFDFSLSMIAVTPEKLVDLAQTIFAPSTERQTDVVCIHSSDDFGCRMIDDLANRWPEILSACGYR